MSVRLCHTPARGIFESGAVNVGSADNVPSSQLICSQGSDQCPPPAKGSLNSPVWLTSRCGVEA